MILLWHESVCFANVSIVVIMSCTCGTGLCSTCLCRICKAYLSFVCMCSVVQDCRMDRTSLVCADSKGGAGAARMEQPPAAAAPAGGASTPFGTPAVQATRLPGQHRLPGGSNEGVAAALSAVSAVMIQNIERSTASILRSWRLHLRIKN